MFKSLISEAGFLIVSRFTGVYLKEKRKLEREEPRWDKVKKEKEKEKEKYAFAGERRGMEGVRR